MPTGTTERLLRRTRRRLFAMTMGLLTLLVVGIGAATAVVALRALHDDVDRAVVDAVQLRADTARGENAGGETGPAGENGGDGTTPADGDAGTDPDRPTGLSDTFVLVLDTTGKVVENRSSYPMAGLPDTSAIAVAASGARDLRTVTVGGVDIRLYTVPILHDGTTLGFVQGGIRLTLLEHETQTLILGIASVGAVGLVGAALITLLVTGRALRPVRDGFETQRRFVADASHELRTPAALIRANAEVLQREGLVGEDGGPLVEDIVAEADRLGGLVGDLLQLAAWDEMRLAVAPVTLDAAAIARDTVRGATAMAAERGVGLAHDAAGPVFARADRDRLVQLLLILVDNAVDHSPRGTTVTVRARRAGAHAVLEVEDQGPGIPPAEQERIFEPFTRLHGTTRHGSGGTGLGLAIARRIAEAMHGSITVSSPEGAGARFIVTLPVADATARRLAANTGASEGDAGGDDEPLDATADPEPGRGD
ncbi:MAG TPA: HAMP domain-containing sensor histidine kinase [Candidatus Limnocylindrales bacterium]